MSTLRKVLITMMIIGGVGSTISAGTYASYTAQTTNASSAFASGSLVLSRQVDSTTACVSTAVGVAADLNTKSDCSAMVTLPNVKPGDAAKTIKLTIVNQGTTTGNLTWQGMDVDAVTGGVQVCKSTQTGTFWNLGTGNLCDGMNMTIQEYTSNAFTTPTASCVFGRDTSLDIPATTNYSSTTASCTALDDGDLNTDSPPTNGFKPSQLKSVATPVPSVGSASTVMLAGQTRYYLVSLRFPNTQDDQFQGLTAQFGLTWSLTG